MGQQVRDGDFAFTVNRLSCGATAARAVSGGGLGEKIPHGARECIVALRVSDVKGRAQTFFDSNQYAYDAAGPQFSADTAATLWLHGDMDNTQVNPGITITARVPFQVPGRRPDRPAGAARLDVLRRRFGASDLGLGHRHPSHAIPAACQRSVDIQAADDSISLVCSTGMMGQPPGLSA